LFGTTYRCETTGDQALSPAKALVERSLTSGSGVDPVRMPRRDLMRLEGLAEGCQGEKRTGSLRK